MAGTGSEMNVGAVITDWEIPIEKNLLREPFP